MNLRLRCKFMKKLLKHCLVFMILATWLMSDWLPIWQSDNLRILPKTHEVQAATTSALYPSGNNGGWDADEANAYADDASYATTAPSTNSTESVEYGNFGFDGEIPAGATINSVTIQLQWKVSTTSSKATLLVDPLVNNGAVGTQHSDATEPVADKDTSYVNDYGSWDRGKLLDGAFEVRVGAKRGTGSTGYTMSLDYVRVVVDYTANTAPSLTISQPDGVSDTVVVGQSYDITYTLSDTEDAATVDFYYDDNGSGLDGTAITDCQDEGEGTSVTCSWNTGGMTPDDYHVYGIATDGINSPVNDYSPGVITIQALVYSVAITPGGTITYGTIEGGQGKSTIDTSDTQTATNDGNTTENLNIMTSNATNGTSWTIGSSAGNNIFVHEFSINGGDSWTKFTAASNYQTLATGVIQSGTQDFDLRITVPTDSDAQEKSITITVQAVAP